MDEIIKIWDIIVKSNTFNFAILLLILAIVGSKLNIGEKLEHIKAEIVKSIENAKAEKLKAEELLTNAKQDVANLEDEVKDRLEKAELHAKTAVNQIMQTAGEKAARFELGVARRIEAEEKTTSATLSKQTAIAAVALAKDHITKTLEGNIELQKKFINESIEELDRVKI